jgi:hypothetical protein
MVIEVLTYYSSQEEDRWLRKVRPVYAKIKIWVESDDLTVPGITKPLHCSVYTAIRVRDFIYSNSSLLSALNLLKEDGVKEKRAIIPWNLSKSRLLKRLAVTIELGNEKKTIQLPACKYNTILESISSKVLLLKSLKIDGKDWEILKVSTKPDRINMVTTD